jgi:hypothetical protein
MGELKLLMRQTPLVDNLNNPVHYAGINPLSLTPTTGTLPTARQWRNYGNYIDITGDTGNIQSLELTWTQDRDSAGNAAPGEFQLQKSASGTLYINGEAYQLIKQWLIDDVSAAINSIDFKIHDTGCNVWFEGYQVRAKDLRWCQDGLCEFQVTLKQREEALNCMRSTLITDNHLGWFPTDGKPINKKHPRFSYCNEIRPNGSLVATWRLGTWNFLFTNTILFIIILIINIIITVINLFRRRGNKIDKIDFGDITARQEETFVDAAGCGREHPAPLIRDYIYNVCKKCGIDVDAASIPIFFDPVLKIESSTGYEEVDNQYINACYLYAPSQRGIRRTESGGIFRAPDYNDTDYWIDDNAPFLTLADLLDQLKPLFNAEWRLINNKLYFNRKDMFVRDGYVYDFAGKDSSKIIEGVCFEYSTAKSPAAIKGIYQDDPIDTCGNEAKKQMNGTLSTGDASLNPILDGVLDKTTAFGATKFRFDAASPDYIYDAAQQVSNSELFTGGLAALFQIIKNVLERIPAYCLLLKDETCTLPKILLWDGESYDQARCYRDKTAYDFTTGMPLPPVNSIYNSDAIPWPSKHPINTFVTGSNFLPYSYPVGYYTVRNFFSTIIGQEMALLVNYSMYFAPEYKGGLWDRFHWIDDPMRFPSLKQQWSVKIQSCCEDIKLLGIENDSSNAALGSKVKLPVNFYPDGKIKEITLSYDPENDLGAYIEIKGE